VKKDVDSVFREVIVWNSPLVKYLPRLPYVGLAHKTSKNWFTTRFLAYFDQLLGCADCVGNGLYREYDEHAIDILTCQTGFKCSTVLLRGGVPEHVHRITVTPIRRECFINSGYDILRELRQPSPSGSQIVGA
jgi:hypothetical protein